VLVLDNLPIHKAKAISELAYRYKEARLRYLPPYSCNLNPIEKVWHLMKQSWRKKVIEFNRDEMTEIDAVEELQSIIRGLKTGVLLRVYKANHGIMRDSLMGKLV
jgi:transposase